MAGIILNLNICVTKFNPMQIVPLVNSLFIVCLLAVVTSMAIMMTSTGYIDKVSHTCFILMATAGFLLLARAAFKKDEEEQQPVQ
jgi:uncharacterized membrane protein YjjP (DUF1212 family)